jgi:HlyD family secretion protein
MAYGLRTQTARIFVFGKKVYLLLGAVFVIALVAYLWMVPSGNEVRLIGIVSGTEVIVSPQLSGRLVRLLVDEGTEVRKGQLVAELDPAELQAQFDGAKAAVASLDAQVGEAERTWLWTRDQTEAAIRQARAAADAASAQVEEARADLWKDRQNGKRIQELFEQGVVSAQDRDVADAAIQASEAHAKSLANTVEARKADLETAMAGRKQVEALQSRVVSLKAQLVQSQEELKQSQIRLDYSKVNAPIDGVVVLRVAKQGEMVAVGDAIVVLLDADHLWVRADVEENLIDSIRIGDRLPVRLPSGAQIEGSVIFKGVEGDFATQRDVSRSKRDIKTFAIKVAVPNSDRKLFTGMTATVILPKSIGAKSRVAGI